MPSYVSPGVYTIEKDISEYTPSINTSIVGIVGFAGKGPTNKATLITSQNNLISTFGSPSEGLTGQGLEGSLEILEQTNSLYFIRAATSDAADASATMSMGTCPSILIRPAMHDADAGAEVAIGATSGWGITSSITFRIQVYDGNGNSQFTQNGGAGKDFSIPAGTAASSQANALRSIIGGSLDSDKVGVFDGNSPMTGLGLSGALVGAYAGSGASLGVSACSGTSFDESKGTSALWGINTASASNSNYGISSLSLIHISEPTRPY